MHRELRQDELYATADLMILTVCGGRLKLLLSRRVNPPCEGCWALPGLFIGLEESAEAAAWRLLQEMLPVRDAYVEQYEVVGGDVRRTNAASSSRCAHNDWTHGGLGLRVKF